MFFDIGVGLVFVQALSGCIKGLFEMFTRLFVCSQIVAICCAIVVVVKRLFVGVGLVLCLCRTGGNRGIIVI